jgi:hypothetical protein
MNNPAKNSAAIRISNISPAIIIIMKPLLNTNNPVLSNASIASSASSVPTDDTALENLLTKAGMDKDTYIKLSTLIGEAHNQGITVDDLLKIYPEFATNKDILNTMLQQELDSSRLGSAQSPVINQTLSADRRPSQSSQLNAVIALIAQLGPDASPSVIAKSNLPDLVNRLTHEQQSTLYGILATSKQNFDTADLNPTASAEQIAPLSSQSKAESPSSALLQKAGEAYKKSDYDVAFHAYQSALKTDPALSQSWPTIYYQLGVCSEYAKNTALNKEAISFYQQYLQSHNPDPKIANWVQKESQWLTNKPQADKLMQNAQNQLYQEQNSSKAFSILKKTLNQFPELANRQPDVYFTMATYAYSAANLSAAKKYLGLAKTAMQAQLKQDPSSKYAQYYMGQIADLMHQVKDPYNNIATTISSFLGDKLGARKFWQELVSGASNIWLGGDHFTPGKGRIYSYNNTAWETHIGSQYDSKTGYTGLVHMHTGSQKQEFDALSAQYNDAKTNALEAEKNLKKLNEKLQKTADELAKAKDSGTTKKLEEQSAQLKQQISEAIAQATPLAQIASVAEENLEEFRKSFSGESYGADAVGRKLKPSEEKELYRLDSSIRNLRQETVYKEITLDQAQQDVAKLQTELEESPDNAETQKALKKAQMELEKSGEDYKKSQAHLKADSERRTGFVDAAKLGEAAGIRYVAETWKNTNTNDIQQRDALKTELASAVESNRSKGEIQELRKKLAIAEKNVHTSENTLREVQTQIEKTAATATSALTPAEQKQLHASQLTYGVIAKKTEEIIKQHDALIDQLTTAKTNKQPTADIEARLKENGEAMQKAIVEGKAAQEAYKATVDSINQSIATSETTYPHNPAEENLTSPTISHPKTGLETSVRTGSIEDMTQLGPGWWGIGQTLDHQQAAAFQWHLGTGAGGKISNDWRGPFASTSKADATQAGVTIASGGKGLNQFDITLNAGVNVANAEHRDYDMVFGGSTGAGIGIGGMAGSQARADVIDAQIGTNYSGGQTNIGGEKIKNMVTVNASAQGAIGVQGDADVSAGIGVKEGKLNASLGAGAGGFAGAQVAGMAGGTVDGVGANVMGQAWAGAGVKANIHMGLSKGKFSCDFGAGAAVGVGAYVDYNVTIDFNQIGQEIAGVGKDAVNLSKKWGNKVPFFGHVAGFFAGAVEGAGKLAVDTVGAISNAGGHISDTVNKMEHGVEKLMGDKLHLGVLGKLGVRLEANLSGMDELADMLAVGTTAKKAAGKSVGKNMVNATDDFLHGHIIKSAEEATVGVIAAPFKKKTWVNIFEHPGRTIKHAFQAIRTAFKKW